METVAPASLRAAFAQPFTQELPARAGVAPGMRVLVAGADSGEIALLVAERVGASGAVVAIDADPQRVERARRRAWEQAFESVSFVTGALADRAPDPHYAAVVGRFYLMYQTDPVATIRTAARLVRDGGRVIFVEWHWESLLWPYSSIWPAGPLYRDVVRSTAARNLGSSCLLKRSPMRRQRWSDWVSQSRWTSASRRWVGAFGPSALRSPATHSYRCSPVPSPRSSGGVSGLA